MYVPQIVKTDVRCPKWRKAYLEQLHEIMQVESIWLFGSRIRGDATEESDLDVAVVSHEFDADYLEAYGKANGVFWHFDIPCNIEVHGLGVKDFQNGGPLVEEIQRYGIQIH